MLIPEVLKRVSFREFLPLTLPLVRGEGLEMLSFTGRLLGQEIEIDAGDIDLPGAIIQIFELEGGKFLSYLGHFSLSEGLWESNHAVTNSLDLGEISNGLHLETAILEGGEESLTVTNVPNKSLGRAYSRALRNYEIIERERC